MASSIKDAFKMAREKKGSEIPIAVTSEKITLQEAKNESYLEVIDILTLLKNGFKPKAGLNNIHTSTQKKSNKFKQGTRSTNQSVTSNITADSLSVYNNPEVPKRKLESTADNLKISFFPTKAEFLISNDIEEYQYKSSDLLGDALQVNKGNWHAQREVVIGLDFGTSSVKLVIGDHTTKKAFAVPFCISVGESQYLLPSRLYQDTDTYSLLNGSEVYRDLKLSLLANPDNKILQNRVVAFLTLLLRHARAWLFSNHGDIYTNSQILWKLSLGLPSADHLNAEHHEVFEKLASVAWYLSALSKKSISYSDVESALNLDMIDIARQEDFAEIVVIPEIAAQIYGYVSSSKFDPNASNIFLMVDIGAGTLDSCLFKVLPGKGGKWDFRFYTTLVQPNGVMNLHRYRMNWWSTIVSKFPQNFTIDIESIANAKLYTDRLSSIPDSINEYFSEIDVTFNSKVQNPDIDFFRRRVVAQVRGATLWKAWNDKYLSQRSLSGIPIYVCGGGARMRFYRQLDTEMANFPGCSWLSASARVLQKPDGLVAPGLADRDYDRLSVAYGLSFLDVNEVLKEIPSLEIATQDTIKWDENYISKDQC